MKKTHLFNKLILMIIVLLLSFNIVGCNKEQSSLSSYITENNSTSSKQDYKSEGSSDASADTSTEETVSSTQSDTKNPSSTPTVSSTPNVSSAPTVPSTPTTSSVPHQPETPAKKTPKELIVGNWSTQYDFADDFTELGFDLGENSVVMVKMEFTPSGSYITMVDSSALKGILRPVLVQEFENKRIESGMSVDEYNQYIFDTTGMSLSEYIESVIAIFDEDLNIVTEYKFENDTLLVKEPLSNTFIECKYEFPNDNTLITIEGNERTTYTRIS